MSCFLAIDVGGTKADYALVDESCILARVRSGTIKRMRVNAETAAKNLDQALHDLTSLSGMHLQSVVRTCVGTAGETVPLVTDWLRQQISARVGGELLILGDVEIALDAAFPGQPGLLVLAGTGSNVAGRTPCGHILTQGGWGPALADQGSGHRIGLEALRALCLAIDSGVESSLLPAVLHFWKLDSISDLVVFANALPAPDFSRLVKIVMECAEAGDVVARAVLDQQGRELAHLVYLLIQRMQERMNDREFMPALAFAGSIMERVDRVRHSMIGAIKERFPGVVAASRIIDPLQGAIWRARSGAGFLSTK